MQNNTTTKKEAVRDEDGNAPAASEPAGKPKSGEGLAVEELADYYANSKPPGRRYPVSMAADMLNNFIDGDAGDAPVDEKVGDAGKKSNSDKKFTVFEEKDNASSASSTLYAPAKGSAMELLNIDLWFDLPTDHPPRAHLCHLSSLSALASHRHLARHFPRMALPSALTPIPTLEVLEGTEMVGLIESCVYAADDTPGCFTLYCRFDELRAVAASKTMFESALTTVSFTFVDHHEYFGHDHANARRAQAVSAYDGRVEFTATPKSMMNSNIKKALRKPCYDFYFL
ncbi:hypothetical protein KCU73_g2741, partial [Aureobasidium melanogenum]